MKTMVQFNFLVSERQQGDVKNLASQTGLTASELMRRLIDAARTPTVFNLIVPAMSGQLVVRN